MSYRSAIALIVFAPVLVAGNHSVTSRDQAAVRRAPLPLSAVTTGTEHACGLSAEGRAYCWGSNRLGQLGDDLGSGRRSATDVATVATDERFVLIDAGANHTCGLTREGVAYCWGSNITAELGQAIVANDCGGFPCNRRPVRVETNVRFDALSAGFGHTCALSEGRAYCWGRNDRGQLGSDRTDDRCDGIACNVASVRVAGVERFASISAGGDHTCGLAEGVALCWGSNQYGQLGRETNAMRNPQPRPVESTERFSEIEAKGISTCARTIAGRRVCW